MTTVSIRERVSTVILFALGIFAVFTGLNACEAIGVAHAAPADLNVPDLAPTLDSGLSVIQQYGAIWGGALLGFTVVSWAYNRYKSDAWFAQGRRLAIATGALSVATSVLAWKLQGADFGGVLLSVLMAVKLIMSPATAAKLASSAGALVLVFALAVPQTGCDLAKNAGHAIVDCTKADQSQIEALLLQFVPLLSGSTPDWSAIESSAIAAGESIGGCAIAQLVNTYLTPKAGRGAPAVDSGRAARAALEDVRAKFGGVTWHTAAADL